MSDSTSAAPRLETGESPRLHGAVNLASVSRLVTAADSLFDTGAERCIIDLSGLESSDSATVALLLEWKRRAARNGCALGFSGIPNKLLDIARISRLEDILRA